MRYLSILWFLLWKIVQNNCCFRVFIFIFPVLKVSITMVISLFRVACSSYNSFFFRFSRNTRLVNCTLNCISEYFKCSFPVTIPFSCNTRLPSRIFATHCALCTKTCYTTETCLPVSTQSQATKLR